MANIRLTDKKPPVGLESPVGVSGSFTAMNYLTLYGSKDQALHQEGWLVCGHGRKSATECVKCGKCEEVCPQHIKIRDELEKVATELLGK